MPRFKRKDFRIYQFFLLIWIIAILGLLYGWQYYLPFQKYSWIIGLFVSINCATFFLYVFDKIQAMTKRIRVPEFVLHLTAFLGGPLGALIAMKLVRHKTRKTSFQFVLGVILLTQLAIAYLFYTNAL